MSVPNDFLSSTGSAHSLLESSRLSIALGQVASLSRSPARCPSCGAWLSSLKREANRTPKGKDNFIASVTIDGVRCELCVAGGRP
jgi:hypothetical protein